MFLPFLPSKLHSAQETCICGTDQADNRPSKILLSRYLTKKTEQCRGKNLKSKSKVPGDSTVFYKTIYISLFGHGEVYWHKQHSHKVFFCF